MKKMIVGILLVLISATSIVHAEKQLTGDEVKTLFSDMSWDGVNELKEKEFKAYASPEGRHMVRLSSGKEKRGKWFVDEHTRHCVERTHLKCGNIFDMGSGVYHKKMNGVHTHTLSNFQKGNQFQ